ncbi:response regulator [Rhodoferax sp.]|uniref:response regulator n=1 Tax=Rhodoferax sp. TaxID=50421 RepID=UPI00271D5079|nr:response regulator [Rhodoferax sp.]MDO9145525.1 response regulator [Rhodoferax sp.]MDP1529110.1 response regulator [Rhodoferax sp.]MDP1945498.1 response regulator [Rhodoferax sp.]MDP2440741.1 response regulator [Rhodoferax sp.]MDP3189820.1 response regulator [Rhodoferax sp.]
MSTITIEKSFCTTREAAKLLGVSVGTVQLWVESGLLRAWKTAGGHRRVMRDSIAQLLRQEPELPVKSVSAEPLFNPPRQLDVMVVEDDADLLRLYQAKLTRWPMPTKVTEMSSAIAALLAIGRRSPDLLITDLSMPEMDGFSMLRILQQAPELAHTTIVAVTGLDEAAIAAHGGLPPGILVLAKPIPFDRLQEIAAVIVNQSRYLLNTPA